MVQKKIPKYDYADQFTDFLPTVLGEIEQLLRTGEYILGPAVAEFENDLARFLGVAETVGVNSGTDALVLTLDALGIGPGDEVITVANTFHATAQAILRRGATPVLVDCGEDDFLIDLDQVEAAVTTRTKAVIVVHMFGMAVDVERAQRLCAGNGLLLVEDCAQAIGARSNGYRVGTLSAAGCWSFAPSKNLAAAGDAGAVSTRQPETAGRIRLLRHFGQRAQNDHQILGYNSRLDTIQALVLRHKLRRVDASNKLRCAVAAAYRSRLAGLPIRFQESAGGQDEPDRHVYHLYQIRLERESVRDALLKTLTNAGIDAVVRYPTPLHLQPALHPVTGHTGQFPTSEALAAETLCLPIRPNLTDMEIDYICARIRAFFGSGPARSAPRP